MNEKLDTLTKGAVTLPAVAAQVTFPAWWPGIDTASDMATKLIPLIGLATGFIYMLVAAMNLWMKIQKAKEIVNADD